MLLMSFGFLSPLRLAAGGIKCTQPETVLRPAPRVATQLTECLMECSGMTYVNKLQLQDNRKIRMKDSTEGKEPADDSFFYLLSAAKSLAVFVQTYIGTKRVIKRKCSIYPDTLRCIPHTIL